MNHEKDQNHQTGCSFTLSAGQLCGAACVAYEETPELVMFVWELRIKISPLMNDRVCSV